MVSNEELDGIFYCECSDKECIDKIKPFRDKIKTIIVEELPLYVPVNELDDVQWEYVSSQIEIIVLDAISTLMCKCHYKI
jgi:hypothetical protein